MVGEVLQWWSSCCSTTITAIIKNEEEGCSYFFQAISCSNIHNSRLYCCCCCCIFCSARFQAIKKINVKKKHLFTLQTGPLETRHRSFYELYSITNRTCTW